MPASGAPEREAERYSVQDLVVDAGTAEVMRGGERIVLPPRTFGLLLALVRHFPHVVQRHDLLETVWQGESVTDQTLSHRVMVLRRALGDDASEPRYVAGARGLGYRLIGPVERMGEGARRSTDKAPPPRRLGWRSVAAALVLGLAAILVITRVVVERASASHRPRTVAVQPLVAHGLAPGLETVASDLTKTIAAQLRRSGFLRVVPWDGKEPRPDLWIEGSLSGSVEQIDLRLRLVSGAERRPLWARDVRGHLYEVLASQEGIVNAAVEAAHRRLGAAASAAPVSSHVRWHCLRANVLWLSWTSEGNRRAEESWRAALEAEPRYAPAHAGIALAKGIAALLGYGPVAAAETEARSYSRRALDLDAQSAMAHAADAIVRLLFDRDIPAAAAAAQRAREAEPEEPAVVIALALVLEAQGRFDEELERLNETAEAEWAAFLLLEGRARQAKAGWNEAIAAYEHALVLEPGLSSARLGRAECLTAAGRTRNALLALRAQGPLSPDDLRSPSPVQAAQELAGAWRAQCGATSPTPRERARACLLGGDKKAALDALHAGIKGRWPFVVFVPKDPAYAALVRQPDFATAFPVAKSGSP